MTTTAIIGLGNMGKGLARRLSGRTELLLASRKRADAEALVAELGAGRAAEVAEAISAADIVILALGYEAALSLASSADLAGKVVVDITNPLLADFSGLQFGHTTSAAEKIQAAAPGARVVKGFNTIFAGLFGLDRAATARVPVFLAGNDAAAVEAVAALAGQAGFAVEKTGDLGAARLLEPLAMLNIRLGYGLGRGTAIAPAWIEVKG